MRSILPSILLATITTACSLVGEKAIVPGYIIVDSIVPGDTSGARVPGPPFTDVYVYSDGKAVGVFQLPARIPIPNAGAHKLTLYGGVWADGIVSQRVNYPFYSVITRPVSFSEGQVGVLGTLVAARDKGIVDPLPLSEDFEAPSLAVDSGLYGGVRVTRESAAPPAWGGGYYGQVVNDTADTTQLEITATKRYRRTLPQTGKPIYAEFDYRCSVPVSIGFYAASPATQGTRDDSQYIADLVVYPNTAGWKRIYVYLTDEARSATSGSDFRLTLRGVSLTKGDYIQVDNIRLVYDK